jgi:hypothetical protein
MLALEEQEGLQGGRLGGGHTLGGGGGEELRDSVGSGKHSVGDVLALPAGARGLGEEQLRFVSSSSD